MNLELLLALSVFAFVASITPGPNNLMLMASGTNYGFTRSVPHLLGVSIGFTIMLLLVGMGLIRLFDTFPVSYRILNILSIGYLLYLAWKIATAAKIEDKPDGENSGKPFGFLQAALFQWVNPKAWAMALTAISAYTPPDQPWMSIVIVALVCGLINLPSVAAWVVLGTRLKKLLNNKFRLTVFNYTAAMLLVGSLYPIVFS